MTTAMLSWAAEKTLENTLISYRKRDLQKLDSQNIIFLQEGTKDQEYMCRYYGFEPIVSPFNVGIARAYQELLDASTGEFFLFLENDWKLLENPYPQILFGRNLLTADKCDIIRYRHRENPGNPLWTRQFEGREYDRPTHLLDSIHWTNPLKFPEIYEETLDYFLIDRLGYFEAEEGILPVDHVVTRFYITSSKNANWTNNPHMAKTSFLKEHVYPRISGNLEGSLQSWWEKQDFKVAQGEGLFTHERID